MDSITSLLVTRFTCMEAKLDSCFAYRTFWQDNILIGVSCYFTKLMSDLMLRRRKTSMYTYIYCFSFKSRHNMIKIIYSQWPIFYGHSHTVLVNLSRGWKHPRARSL
uniref:Uncharacterized protein n=1 Tax=Cacopsylla melanoneura TaxID=428564 RepID=A0A8D8XA51_9HEMI